MAERTPSRRISSAGRALVTLVLGGARSGKSRFAEELLADRAGHRLYLATAEARDAEMAARIERHRQRRGAGWRVVEAPLDVAPAIAAAGKDAVLLDCLTLWLSNLMSAGRDVEKAAEELCRALGKALAPIVVVSNEVGLGIVPDNALARDFRDQAGRLNQQVAAAADRVYFMAAGLPLILKDEAA